MFKRCALMMVLTPLVMIVLGLAVAVLGPNFIHQRPTTTAPAAR